jgi:two-component system, cell cycle response regulator DivK
LSGKVRQLNQPTIMRTSLPRRPVVLLVQPHNDDRAMYAAFLRHEGFRALCPNRALDALRLAPRADVIVTGMLLDDTINGIDLIARLRADAATQEKPIAVLTACAWNSERERAIAAGCDVFLPKPCLPEDLVREIRRLVSGDSRRR